jgi:hypothetical protein
MSEYSNDMEERTVLNNDNACRTIATLVARIAA